MLFSISPLITVLNCVLESNEIKHHVNLLIFKIIIAGTLDVHLENENLSQTDLVFTCLLLS